MAVVFLDPRPAGAASVGALESRVGARMPEAFRELLVSVSNGGEIEPVASHSFPTVGVASVLGVDRGDHLDLEKRLGQYSGGRLPEGLLPVADAEGGNLVCLSLRSSDFGTVWFWDHERELVGDAVMLVADDLGQFLADLAPVAQSQEPSAITDAWIDPSFLEELQGGKD